MYVCIHACMYIYMYVNAHEFVDIYVYTYILYMYIWQKYEMNHLHVTLFVHLYDTAHSTWPIHPLHDVFTCDMFHWHATWLLDTWHDPCTCDMTHSHVWHDSFSCDTGHDAFTCLTCDMTDSYVWLMTWEAWHTYTYGVAMISRLLKIIGLFCRI